MEVRAVDGLVVLLRLPDRVGEQAVVRRQEEAVRRHQQQGVAVRAHAWVDDRHVHRVLGEYPERAAHGLRALRDGLRLDLVRDVYDGGLRVQA